MAKWVQIHHIHLVLILVEIFQEKRGQTLIEKQKKGLEFVILCYFN